jgi:hypothetical protein
MTEHKCKCAGCTKSAKAERERIIAILEAEGFEYRPLAESPRNLIALIKGEN